MPREAGADRFAFIRMRPWPTVVARRQTSRATLLLALLVSGCGVSPSAGRPAEMPSRALSVGEQKVARCPRSVAGAGHPFREALPGQVTDPELRRYADRLSPDVRRTAVAAGVEPLLARLLQERDRTSGRPTVETLALRSELDERLGSLPGQLLATEFECECVIAATDDALRKNDELERGRERDLTIATLIAGAAFSVGAGGWDLANRHATDPAAPDGPIATAIVGAALTAGLGAAILVERPHPIVFVHEHNLLAPIVRGADEGKLYPTFVFRMLTSPTAAPARSPREQLLEAWGERWRDAGSRAARPLAEQIMYGSGGVYDPGLLALRRRLFEDLETTLDSLSRDVDRLNAEVAALLNAAPQAEK